MKKLLLSVLSIGLLSGAMAQERYLDEIFTGVDMTANVQYGTNYNFILPYPAPPLPNFALKTDVYQPSGDSETNRAAVIVLHTGNFLPKYLNQSATGNNKDSSIVVSAELFAKRGYVAFAPAYRLGWDPTNSDADVRRGTLLNAVYHALGDVKALVRYIKKTVAEDGNPYGVNPDRIIIYGQGSGGYLSLAYGSLDRIEELENEASGKWLSTSTINNFVENQLYINTDSVGGIDGFGGVYNDTNYYGYSNDVVACVNVGGALGDSAWMEAGEPPLISFHVPDDGFAPFTQGLVIVPTTQEVVVDVVGSRWAIGRANELGNNDVLYGSTPYNDPYTVAAETALASSHFSYPSALNPTPQEYLNLDPSMYKGLFPFIRPQIQWPFQESSPWDWWDEQVVMDNAAPIVGATAAQAIIDNGASGSPTMSAAQGRAYLDSIQGYLAPRLYHLINSDVSVQETEFVNSNTYVYPNPANDFLVVKTNQGIRITDIEIYDMKGSLVRTENGLNKFSHQINGINQMPEGLYLVKVSTDSGMITRKVFVD
ncbi:MAG: T9SS type A sorting domain-containing protein [Flavobacteriales bacterium]|nr:T9SS type A sorting domain-containing protein [Flavobacteriales bacterium]